MTADIQTEKQGSLAETIGKLAYILDPDHHVLGSGDLAELRRLDPESIDRAVFWKIAANYISPDRELSPEEERRWAVVLSGMARLPHQSGRSPGRVLAETKFSEQRIERLLRAETVHEFAPLIRRLAHYLKSKNEPIDWTGLARLVLSQNPEKREEARRALARDYYQNLGKEIDNE